MLLGVRRGVAAHRLLRLPCGDVMISPGLGRVLDAPHPRRALQPQVLIVQTIRIAVAAARANGAFAAVTAPLRAPDIRGSAAITRSTQ